MSCFLTSYLEDIISGSNIWNSFIQNHSKLYGKKLPYYNTQEYVAGEINIQDVLFLVWYFINTVQDEKFISPYNEFIVETAAKVMDVLEKEYEYAPENENLRAFYWVDNDETDYYAVRNIIDNVLFNSYLFFHDTFIRLAQQELEIIEESADEQTIMLLQENRDAFLSSSCTRLLSLKGKEWVAGILGKDHPLSSYLLNLSQRISGFFLYKGQNNEDILLEHIASGKEFRMTKKSFDWSENLKIPNCIIFIGIVNWKNEWWFSGVYTQMDYNAELVAEEKNSLKSRMSVNFLDHNEKDTEDILSEQLKAFLTFNNGSQIAFMPTGEIESFSKKFIDYYNRSLTLTDKEKEDARARTKSDGFFGRKDNESIDFEQSAETGLFFFNPKSGGEIALDVNNAFPLKNNPFFDIEDSENDIMHVLISEQISTELAMFCINNCKSDLPFFTEDIGKEYLKDIDFLLRFWKMENYHTKPSITFTGRNSK